MTSIRLIAAIAPASSLLFSLVWIVPCVAHDALFATASGSPVKIGPGSGELVLADVNQDGHLDMVAQHLHYRHLTVQLGDGQGRFVSATNSPMSLDYQPRAIAVADVNNDGMPDLCIADQKDGDKEYVRIYLGNDQLNFSEAAGSPLAISASVEGYKPRLRLVDVNEDDTLDIVAANGRRSTIEILIGDGRGQFTTGPVLQVSGLGQHSFAIGDVDGDRHVDIVTASTGGPNHEPGSVVAKRGNGKANFEDAAPSIASTGARIATLADVNGDQHADIVFVHDDRNYVSVGLNDGNGVFKTGTGSTFDVGMAAFAVVVADVNRDSKADLLVATVESRTEPFESRIAVLLGDGGGKFVAAPGSPFAAGPGAYSLAAGDINEDGKVDIVASSFEGEAVTILVGR